MSSSNLVRVAFIPEVTYGVTPGSGDFETARFTSESLSGTPETVESQQIRTDRQSSGQIVTGLTVGGDLAIELAKEDQFEEFLESAMYSTWQTQALVTEELTIDATAKTLTNETGNFVGLVKGDFIKLGGFTNPLNNVYVLISDVTGAVATLVVPEAGLVDETGVGRTYKRADKLAIGTTKKSFSMEKKFLDLTNKGIVYRGMICSTLELAIAFGDLVTGSIGFSGNDYQTVDAAIDFITNARTVNPPATSGSLNGSIDMPLLATAAIGNFDSSDLAIQSLTINLDNGLSAQNVIGDIAPRDYSAGTARIEIGLSAYLNDPSWPILAKKLSQESFAVGGAIYNFQGGYGFYMPAVQVSFEDPASAGQNQDILLDMSGQAKVGDNQESALTLYRLVV